MASVLLNSEALKNWDKIGKQEIAKKCKSLVKPDTDFLDSKVAGDVTAILYSVCRQCIYGGLQAAQVTSLLNEIMGLHRDMLSQFVDVLSLFDTELLAIDDAKTEREKFNQLVKDCCAFVPEILLKERLFVDSLELIGILPSKQAFQSKYVKTKTRLFYKQQKFNLLREENEGYSKLLTELVQSSAPEVPPLVLLQNIKSLIGCFDLDPNRVLDVILEAFECRAELHDFYIPIITNYISDKDALCHILGHKFHFYQETQDAETPSSLYKVAAILLHKQLINLDALYPHLRPTDQDVIDQHKKTLQEAKLYAKKFNVVSLADRENAEKDKDQEKETRNEQHINNQKLGLVEALLKIGDWDHAQKLIIRLPPYFATSYRPVAEALCELVHRTVDNFYETHNGLSSRITRRRCVWPRNDFVIPSVQSFATFADVALPMACHLGPYGVCDPVLVVKLMRVSKLFLQQRARSTHMTNEQASKDVYFSIMTYLDEVVLPAMSMMDGNCCMSEEVWSILKLLPYEHRYRLYGQWKNDTMNSNATLVRRKADCIEKAKYILKRLTKENSKPMGRQIGKLSHHNPGAIFDCILSQIQKYDNFIGPVVDALKYLTSLSYDVLAYCIIEALANPAKERMKFDDTNISLWLQSLANFAGAVSRKYPMELGGLVQYVLNQLKAGKSYDLLILQEVIQKMTGIEVSEDITDDQLEAMSGGETLRQEGGYFTQIRNMKKSSSRLKEAIVDQGLVLPLFFLMAQQRDSIIFSEEQERHLKLVGKLYDQCQDTLVQFGSFLSSQLSANEMKNLPSIDTLVLTYHVPPDAAFFLLRPHIANAIQVKYDELRKSDKETSLTKKYVEACTLVLSPITDVVSPLHPAKIWHELSPRFYVLFWSLNLNDIHNPTGAYERQIATLEAQKSEIKGSELPESKTKKELERCDSLINRLRDEQKRQSDHVTRVKARLNEEMKQWFHARSSTKNETITQFLQQCIFPRCCFSAPDAVFCAKFIHTLHELKTPDFSSLICYDRIFCDVTNTVTCCTEREAHRYGRFLCAVLDPIMRWHAEPSVYEKECANYPGFVTVFRKGKDSNNIADQLEFENYRHVCHKWHFRITKAMVGCLGSGNYAQIRNAFIVLTKILPHYPRIQLFGQVLEKKVEDIKDEEKEKRPDMYALAAGYSGQLRAKSNLWVEESKFHKKDPKDTKVVKASDTVKPEPIEKREVPKETAKEPRKATEPRPVKNDTKTREEPRVRTNGEHRLEEVKTERRENNSDDVYAAARERASRERRLLIERAAADRGDFEPGQLRESRSPERERTKFREEKRVKSDKVDEHRRSKEDKQRERDDHHRYDGRDDYKLYAESQKDREARKQQQDRSPNLPAQSSTSSLHRRSSESSPKTSDERGDAKRRKMDTTGNASSSVRPDVSGGQAFEKELSKTPSTEKERDRKERKRDRASEGDATHQPTTDTKKRRSEDPSRAKQQNGESLEPKRSGGLVESSPHAGPSASTNRPSQTTKEKTRDRDTTRLQDGVKVKIEGETTPTSRSERKSEKHASKTKSKK